MNRKYLILVAMAIFAESARAQETPADLVAKLGSRSYAERERAAKKLESLGKAALPALQKALAFDLETKRRASALIEKIEDRLIVDELLTATPVRFQFQSVPIGDALREADRRLNLPLADAGKKEKITLDTGTIPYWQAWRRLREAGKLHENDFAKSAAKLQPLNQVAAALLLEQYRREFDIRLRYVMPRVEFAAGSLAPPYAEDDRGSVRVRLRWHSLDDAANDKKASAIFAIEVRPEPRLEIASLPKAEILKIVDDAGREREVRPIPMYPSPASPQDADLLASYVGEVQYGGLLQLRSFAWTGPPRTLKEVHGRVRMNVTVKPTMMAMPNVVKAVGKQMRGDQGITVKVLEAEVREQADLHLRLRLDHLDSLTPKTDAEKIVRVRPGLIAERGPMDVALGRLELADASGRKCPLTKSRYEHLEGDKGYDAVLRFSLPSGNGDDLTLTMTKAARKVALDSPFVVRDVVWSGASSKAGK